jgi:hypothetical protein
MSFFPRLFTKRKAELHEEIQAHLQMDIQNRKDRGESAEQAHTAAIREFGNVALIEDVTRESWGWVWLERLGQDLKYAFRQLRRSPVFTITVIATLTLGLGQARLRAAAQTMGRRTKLRVGGPSPSPRTRLRTARNHPREPSTSSPSLAS